MHTELNRRDVLKTIGGAGLAAVFGARALDFLGDDAQAARPGLRQLGAQDPPPSVRADGPATTQRLHVLRPHGEGPIDVEALRTGAVARGRAFRRRRLVAAGAGLVAVGDGWNAKSGWCASSE